MMEKYEAVSLRLAGTLACVTATLLPVGHALASQGPGASAGGAGPTTQLAMAIIVYGLSAAIVLTGLIGATRKR